MAAAMAYGIAYVAEPMTAKSTATMPMMAAVTARTPWNELRIAPYSIGARPADRCCATRTLSCSDGCIGLAPQVVDLLWPSSLEFFECGIGDDEVATARADLKTRLPRAMAIGSAGGYETEIGGNAGQLGAEVRWVLRVVRLDADETDIAEILENGSKG